MVLLVLLVLGLSLVDLTVVQASALTDAKASRTSIAANVALFTTWTEYCADDACSPSALPASAERPNAARARVPGPVEAGAARSQDILARLAPLATQLVPLALTSEDLPRHDLPWRPAREAGADSSVPRPPPS